MSDEICRCLWEQEKELKKHSVYMPVKYEEDSGFEFFVLCDPDETGSRTSFLKELHNLVVNGIGDFVEPENKMELKKWLGTNSDDDPMLTPLNWLKVAIERYPYRLFLVIDPGKWESNGKTPIENENLHKFLKKRICWIDKKEFYRDNTNLEKMKTWLTGLWISHILRNIREYQDIGDIFIRPHAMNISETSYIPSTLPFDRDIEPKSCYDSLAFNLKNPGDGLKKNERDANFPILFFSRHGDFWEFGKVKDDRWDFNEEIVTNSANIIYSENLSGSLSFFSRFLTALEKIEEIKSELFLLKMIEQASFRIGISDERFQEWWGKLDTMRSGSIFQSRLTAIYWDNENRYGQKNFPRHQAYCCYKSNSSHGIEWGEGKGEDFKELWPQHQRGMDILIIHQGILDKWGETKNQSELTKNILNLKEHFPFVVITSGRGMPENLPFGVKFLPFSGIEMCMVGSYFERITLFRQLMSLTSGD